MKIMVCDDSLMIRRQMKNLILEIGNYEIIEAGNGVVAIELYKKENPLLVYMDIIMPELDGIEAVKGIMNHDKAAKIVMLSSVGTKENLQKALKEGALDFIQKPIDSEAIKNSLNKYVGRG